MSSPVVPPSDCEVHAVIKFLTLENVSGAEIYQRLSAAYGANNVMSRPAIHQWIKMFKDGRTNTHDKDREGRPSTSVNDKLITIVRTLLEKDRRLTVTDLHHKIVKYYPYINVG